jgi:hypothetical protein
MRGRVRKLEDDTFIVVYYKECVEDSEAVIPVSCKLMPGFSHFKDGDNIEFELVELVTDDDGNFSNYAMPIIKINPHIAKVIDTNEDGEEDMGDKIVDLLSTLKSKIYWSITNDGSTKGCGLAMKNAENIENLFDNYAIEFAEWLDKLTPRQRVSVWSKNGESKGLFNMDNEQLLEIFKKEKGL